MHIQELEEGGEVEELVLAEATVLDRRWIGAFEPKRVIVGFAARFLFYPTLFYNVLRNKFQPNFRWWDEVDQFLLLGAVPFPGDVPRLRQIGVGGVVTLNEPYETLVPTSLYHAYGIEHLVLPTRDYLFAPSFGDICRAVDFIHNNVSCGKVTYVHCKAGRGRSTTIVLCYLVKYRQMTPSAAYEYVRLNRPRVLLASSQWKAVLQYHGHAVDKSSIPNCLGSSFSTSFMNFTAIRTPSCVDDGSFVMVSKSDLDGYDRGCRFWADLSLVCRMQLASQAALARLSCLWLGCQDAGNPAAERCALEVARLGMVSHPCVMTVKLLLSTTNIQLLGVKMKTVKLLQKL